MVDAPGDITDPTPYIDSLFKGAGSTGGGKFKENCTDNDGEIIGIGPECVLTEEEGERDITVCFYENTAELLYALQIDVGQRCDKITAFRLDPNFDHEDQIEDLEIEIEDLYEVYEEALDDLEDTCECKICAFTINKIIPKEEEEIDEEDTDEPDIDTDTADNFGIQQVKTTSSYKVIPRVFGRYVVPGNIIWIGNQQAGSVTYVKQVADDELAVIVETVNTIDFLLGLAVGPINAIMRIWIDDVLVFNDTLNVDEGGTVTLSTDNNGSTDIFLSALADGDYSLARLAAFKPTIEFHDGSAGQNTIDQISEIEGLGNVPAHRGLATIYFRGIDLRLFGNQFPEIQVEVIENAPASLLPNIQSADDGMDTDFLYVDHRTNTAYVRDGDDVNVYNYSTLVQEASVTPDASITGVLPLVSGNVAVQTAANDYIYDVFHDIQRDAFAYGPITPASISVLGYDAAKFAFDFGLVTDTDGAIDIVKYSYTSEIGSLFDSITGDSNYTAEDSIVTVIDGIKYLFQFTLATPTQSSLRVNRYTLNNETGLFILDNTAVPVTYDVTGTALWGAATSGLTVQAVLDNADGDFVVFVRDSAGADTVAKLAVADLTTVWSSVAPTLPPVMNGLISVNPYYYYVSEAEDIVRLDLVDGTVLTLDALSDFSLPGLSGAQYYDGNTGSVLYVSDNAPESLVRVFPEKVVAEPVSIANIFDKLAAETPMPPFSLDTSDADDVTLYGYLIDKPANIATVMGALGQLYQVNMTDDGTKLFLLKDSTLSATTAIDNNNILLDTLHTTRELTKSKTQVATATFYNIDDFGIYPVEASVALHPDLEENTSDSINFSLQINDDATAIRQRLEKVLLNILAETGQLSVQFMPRMLGLTPRDRISIDGTVYRISKILTGPTGESLIDGFDHDQTALTTTAEIVAGTQDRSAVRRPKAQYPYKPVMLFMPCVRDEDQARVEATGGQIIYTGLETPDRTVAVPLTFAFRTDKNVSLGNFIDYLEDTTVIVPPTAVLPSPLYTTQQHTEGLHWGTVTTIPDVRGDFFSTDNESTLIIEFKHTSSVAALVTPTAPIDVLETPTVNLLVVGGEYIQFGSFSVDGDGVTVTFGDLYRGRFGTEWFSLSHAVGERAYLYTPESFKPVLIDSQFTKQKQRVRVFYPQAAFAGTPLLSYTMGTDQGSARPMPPGILTRYELFGNPDSGGFTWTRRRNMSIDLMDNLGWSPEDTDASQYLLFPLNRMPTSMADWDTGVTLPILGVGNFDFGLINSFGFANANTPFKLSWGSLFTSTFDPGEDTIIWAVVEYVTNTSGQFIAVGYPTFATYPWGNVDTYPDFP